MAMMLLEQIGMPQLRMGSAGGLQGCEKVDSSPLGAEEHVLGAQRHDVDVEYDNA